MRMLVNCSDTNMMGQEKSQHITHTVWAQFIPGAGVGGREAEGPEVQPSSLVREPGLPDFKKHVAGDLRCVELFMI